MVAVGIDDYLLSSRVAFRSINDPSIKSNHTQLLIRLQAKAILQRTYILEKRECEDVLSVNLALRIFHWNH